MSARPWTRRPDRRGGIRARAGLAVAAVVFAIGGCETPVPSTAAPTPTPFVAEPTPGTTTYQLNTDVWYAGLVLHMDLATAHLDNRGGTVDVAFRIDNPGKEDADLNAKMTLVVAGSRIVPTRESHVPTTPAGQTALGLLTFELQGIASAADGVLEIGADPDHIAIVPFSPGGQKPVTYKPVTRAVSGSGSAATLSVSLRRTEVRWDLPDWNQELSARLRAVTVTYDVTYTGSFSGGFAFTGDNIALRLPNGKIVNPRPDGHSQSIELLTQNHAKKGLFSRFEIPANAKGKFALIVRNGPTSRSIPFTIGG